MIRQYFRNARIIAITEAILQLRGLILLPFLTRHFGPVNYGVWSQVAVLITTVQPLIVLGTDSGFIRTAPGKKLSEQKGIFYAWMMFQLAMNLIFGALIVIFSDALVLLIFGEGGGEYKGFLLLAAVWLMTSSLTNITRNWFKIRNSTKLYSLSVLLQAVFSALAAVIMLLRNEGPFELVSYSLMGDGLLVLLSAAFIFFRYGIAKPDLSSLSALLKYGLPLVPAAFATWGLNYADRFFLVNLDSIAQVGIYAVAYRISYQIIPLLAKPWWVMFSNSAAELFNKGETKTLQRLFNYNVGLTIALAFPASAGLFLIGDRLIRIFSTEEFISGVPVLLLISSAYIFPLLEGYYVNALGLVYRHGLFTINTVIALAINIVLNILLIPKYSILGAAIATNIAFLSSLLMTMYFSAKYKAIETNLVFPAKVFAATLGMSALVRILDFNYVAAIGNNFLEMIILSAFGVLGYVLIMWSFGIINKSKLNVAASMLKP